MLVLSTNRRPVDLKANRSQVRLMDKMNKVKTKGKNRRAGSALKFHNFVANCSASTNSNGSTSKTGTTNETTHCLKEEHGTKQITVSHWRKSNSSLEPSSNVSSNLSGNHESSNSVLTSNLSGTAGSANRSSSKIELWTDPMMKTNNKVSKAKSFSLLSNSNSLISRTDFTLTSPPSDPNNNFLIKNLITNNSLQYFNGKQKHLNLKHNSSSCPSSSSSSLNKINISPTSSKFKSTSQLVNQLNNNSSGNQIDTIKLHPKNQLISTCHYVGNLDNQLGNQLNSQLNNRFGNQIGRKLNQFGLQSSMSNQLRNRLGGQLNRNLNQSNRKLATENNLSLNLQQSIDQINLLLNDNFLQSNESILGNLLTNETTDLQPLIDSLNSKVASGEKFETLNSGCDVEDDGEREARNDDMHVMSDRVDRPIKTNRRKPIFVRRLIKVENEDALKRDDEQPLDLSLKKRKSHHLNNLDESTSSTSALGEPIEKQSTNDSD